MKAPAKPPFSTPFAERVIASAQKSRLWRTTAFRLTTGFGVLFILVTVLVLGLVYVQTNDYLTRRVDHIILREASAMRDRGAGAIADAVTQAASDGSLTVAGLFSNDGRPIVGDHQLTPQDVPLDGAPHAVASRRLMAPQRVLAERLPWGQILVVRRDASQLVEVRTIVLGAVLWSGGFISVGAILLSVLLSLKPLRRVRDVQRASHAVANGDLTVRLPVDRSHDELDDLAQIVNVMMDEVERLMGQAKSFGEAVAHELRTPLTRLRASLDHAAQGLEGGDPRKALMETCVAETDSLLSRFRALLRIAAVEARNRQSRIAEVRLSAIVEQVGELYAPLAVARGIALRVDVEPEVSARADGELMFEAISNLVDNGLKFTPAGGSVHLTLSPSEDGPIVEVRDSGIGIPADDVALITKRFYRSANVGHIQGHGLGLSLVAAVADMHGFELAIGDAAPGALFRILCRPRGPSPFSVAG